MVETIPLFPLNTVLFPGMPISLHIFEERYKMLLEDCQNHSNSFGIIFLREGKEAYDKDVKTYRVGTLAKIHEVSKMANGRANLTAVGTERFLITSYDKSLAYLQAHVEWLPLVNDTEDEVLRTEMQALLEEYLATLKKSQNIPPEIPNLAYLGANLLQIDSKTKQEILLIDEADGLYQRVIDLYKDHLRLIKMKSSFSEHMPGGPFSQN